MKGIFYEIRRKYNHDVNAAINILSSVRGHLTPIKGIPSAFSRGMMSKMANFVKYQHIEKGDVKNG